MHYLKRSAVIWGSLCLGYQLSYQWTTYRKNIFPMRFIQFSSVQFSSVAQLWNSPGYIIDDRWRKRTLGLKIFFSLQISSVLKQYSSESKLTKSEKSTSDNFPCELRKNVICLWVSPCQRTWILSFGNVLEIL